MAPSEFIESGITFKNAEQYMMYHKAMLFSDVDIADKILKAGNPAEIRAFSH